MVDTVLHQYSSLRFLLMASSSFKSYFSFPLRTSKLGHSNLDLGCPLFYLNPPEALRLLKPSIVKKVTFLHRRIINKPCRLLRDRLSKLMYLQLKLRLEQSKAKFAIICGKELQTEERHAKVLSMHLASLWNNKRMAWLKRKKQPTEAGG